MLGRGLLGIVLYVVACCCPWYYMVSIAKVSVLSWHTPFSSITFFCPHYKHYRWRNPLPLLATSSPLTLIATISLSDKTTQPRSQHCTFTSPGKLCTFTSPHLLMHTAHRGPHKKHNPCSAPPERSAPSGHLVLRALEVCAALPREAGALGPARLFPACATARHYVEEASNLALCSPIASHVTAPSQNGCFHWVS